MSDASDRRELRFHRSIYEPEAIAEAVRAFGDLATITVQENDADTLVVIERPDPEVADMICDELANYALVEAITRSRADALGGGA